MQALGHAAAHAGVTHASAVPVIDPRGPARHQSRSVPLHLFPCFLLIPKRSQSSPKLSSASSIAATNFTRSFVGDVSFQGMPDRLHVLAKRVTHVPGPICHLCTRSEPAILLDEFSLRRRLKSRAPALSRATRRCGLRIALSTIGWRATTFVRRKSSRAACAAPENRGCRVAHVHAHSS